ncbi:MAG TPA: patatin-like phospholipase family protein, partial [Saprospiraceae bacterium]|nr:patatin-like phospholipase family protein [Saprospiraceae bacterium]
MNTSEVLTPEEFTENLEVISIIAELNKHFNDKNPLIVSDIIDDDRHQYVDLVQKGGGVLGIALVGYTYVLEQMGIRFFKLAGTSAGAINTSLMTVISDREKPKSEEILKILCSLDFMRLVDGHWLARFLIKSIISKKKITCVNWKNIFLISFLVILFCDILFLGLRFQYQQNHFIDYISKSFFIVTGFYLAVFGSALIYISNLLNKLKNSGFGINPGDYFYDWVKFHFKENGVETVSEFQNKANKIPDIKLREGTGKEHPEGIENLTPKVALITSELVTQNKVHFPEMCDLFRIPEYFDKEIHPAGFVRASMAIPGFFESYFIEKIPINNSAIQLAWKTRFQIDKPPTKVRFVDGGLLSNFPISIFFDPIIVIPRLPTFGINLDDSTKDENAEDPENWSTGSYAGRLINTMRSNYDKDFLLKNAVYSKGIGSIKLSNYNWLNFFLTKDEKLAMLIEGAKSAKA